MRWVCLCLHYCWHNGWCCFSIIFCHRRHAVASYDFFYYATWKKSLMLLLQSVVTIMSLKQWLNLYPNGFVGFKSNTTDIHNPFMKSQLHVNCPCECFLFLFLLLCALVGCKLLKRASSFSIHEPTWSIMFKRDELFGGLKNRHYLK